jgi:hypothetical protein
MFKIGHTYTRQQIRDALGGGLQDYLPHDNGQVVCGCFRKKDTNPDAPDIILPGNGRDIQKWARVFREQNYPVPIFIKKQVNAWMYVGDYHVERWTEDLSEIAKHATKSGRRDITSVLFLKRR